MRQRPLTPRQKTPPAVAVVVHPTNPHTHTCTPQSSTHHPKLRIGLTYFDFVPEPGSCWLGGAAAAGTAACGLGLGLGLTTESTSVASAASSAAALLRAARMADKLMNSGGLRPALSAPDPAPALPAACTRQGHTPLSMYSTSLQPTHPACTAATLRARRFQCDLLAISTWAWAGKASVLKAHVITVHH